MNTNSKNINIDLKDILKIVEESVLSCYGIISFTSKEGASNRKNQKKGKIEEGVTIHRYLNQTFSIDIYVALSSEVKITETLRECQKIVSYNINKKYPHKCLSINVFATDIKSI